MPIFGCGADDLQAQRRSFIFGKGRHSVQLFNGIPAKGTRGVQAIVIALIRTQDTGRQWRIPCGLWGG